MKNLIERALQTFWQAALAAGAVDAVGDPSWESLLVALVVGLVGLVLSAAKTYAQESGWLPTSG